VARRAQSTSPHTPLHETKTEAPWWRTPAVIAAVIAGLAAISVALIHQCTASKPKSSDAPPMTQETHGPDSPAIAGVQGSVTVAREVHVTASGSGTAVLQTGQGSSYVTNIHGISPEDYRRLSSELDVTESALKSFFKILEQQHVPREDLDSTLRDIAKKYKTLQDQLQAFTSDDPAVVALKQAASQALEAGDFAQAETLLNEASQKDLEGAQQFQEMATKRWLSAAASKAELGVLKDTQLRYAEAATYYRQAVVLVESIPKGAEAILATYLTEWVQASWRAGDYSNAEPRLQRALATRQQVLGPDHPDVATSLNNLAELYRTRGQYAEAEPLYRRALAIGEKKLGPNHPLFETILKNYLVQLHNTNRQVEAEQLTARFHATRSPLGWLGVELTRYDEVPGILVERVIADGPAAQAGVQPGDVIVRFQGHTVPDAAAFVRSVTAMEPGTTVECEVMRNGQPLTLQVTLGARPMLPP
jgi:tetratricopeptide (TPR) repeat protein